MDIAVLHAFAFGLGCTLHLLQSIIGPVKLGALTSNELMRLIRELWVISAPVCMASWCKPAVWPRCQSTGWENPKWWAPRQGKFLQTVGVQCTEHCMNVEGTGLSLRFVHVCVSVFIKQELFSLVMQDKKPPCTDGVVFWIKWVLQQGFKSQINSTCVRTQSKITRRASSLFLKRCPTIVKRIKRIRIRMCWTHVKHLW